MAPQNHKKTQVLVARSRRTGEKYPIRTSHLIEADRGRATEGLRAERVHYLGKDKDIACRCNRSDHLNYRQVRNSEIQELCAQFFMKHSTETTCNREQWRAVDLERPEVSRVSSMPKVGRGQSVSRRTSLSRDSFEYDSPSMIELLKGRDARSLDSKKLRSRPPSIVRLSQSRPSSLDSDDMIHLSHGPDGEADIPESVWRVGRPSVYLSQHNAESLASTPLGSSVIPAQQNVYYEPTFMQIRSSTLKIGAEDPGLRPQVRSWYGLAHNPGPSMRDSPIDHRLQHATRFPCHVVDYCRADIDLAGLQVSVSDMPRPSTAGSAAAPAGSDHVVELPSSRITVEFNETPPHSPPHHSPTLRELEGGSFEHVSELAGRRTTVPSKSRVKTSSYRLTRLIDQPLWNSKLPCQEDFFSKWVDTGSRTRFTPVGNCSLCQNSFDAPNKRTARLTCGHYVHHECLLVNFRVFDLEFGNCPVCGMTLCERTLHDRIDTDREAIFGQSFTNLRAEERIELASRGETIVCWSEEEVAAAQLRLLKEYIDAHADELYRQWSQTSFEPDWHSAVVIPVVQLFKGWNLPARKCRYFANRDTFYKLVVWAELVRLMNTIRDAVKRVRGENAPFPPLSELHRMFMMTKDRYESEKRTWPTDRCGVLHCDKIAQDAFSMAIGTHIGRSE